MASSAFESNRVIHHPLGGATAMDRQPSSNRDIAGIRTNSPKCDDAIDLKSVVRALREKPISAVTRAALHGDVAKQVIRIPPDPFGWALSFPAGRRPDRESRADPRTLVLLWIPDRARCARRG
jgi:hypothetical protein